MTTADTPAPTVYNAFINVFPNSPIPNDIADNLRSMPLDTDCGDECEMTIYNADNLVQSIRTAYGDDRPEYIQSIADITAAVCQCFICG